MSGTPVLNLVRETLAGAEILEMQGILNGTTNYILTRMEEGLSYEAALAKAQAARVRRGGPGRRRARLGRAGQGHDPRQRRVRRERSSRPTARARGSPKITPADIAQAKADGKRYKLIGRVWREGGGGQRRGRAAPRGPRRTRSPASMGATNAVTITTDALGEVTIVGPGAGQGADRLRDAHRSAARSCGGAHEDAACRPVGRPRQDDRGPRPVRQLADRHGATRRPAADVETALAAAVEGLRGARRMTVYERAQVLVKTAAIVAGPPRGVRAHDRPRGLEDDPRGAQGGAALRQHADDLRRGGQAHLRARRSRSTRSPAARSACGYYQRVPIGSCSRSRRSTTR